jgi:HK97 family phage portal protein
MLATLIRGAETRSTLAHPDPWLINAFGSTRTYAGKTVTAEKALGVSAVYGAVSLIAEKVGSLPLKVYRQVEPGEDDDTTPRLEARDHRAWKMLHDSPNPYQPADRFWSAVCTHLLLYGNAFLPHVRGSSGLVEELRLESASLMSISIGPDGVKRFEINDERGKSKWTSANMTHIWGFSLDGLVGLSPITVCRNPLATAMARDEFEGGFYQRGALLSGVLETPGRLGDTAARSLRESFKALFAGSGNAGGVPVLEEGMTFKPATMMLEDMQFVESAQLSRTDIANIFNLPPSYLGGTTGNSLTYATVEGNQIQLAENAIAPRTGAIQKALSVDTGIFPQQSYYCEFTLEALARGDMATRSEFYKSMTEVGAIVPDEIRARENLPPLPEGMGKKPRAVAGQSAEQNANGAANVNGNGGVVVDIAELVGS